MCVILHIIQNDCFEIWTQHHSSVFQTSRSKKFVNTEDLCQACGEPFWVEMEVLDRHANPCPPTSVLALGPPTFAPQLELLELDRPLQVRLWPLRVFHHSTGLGLGLGLG